MVDGRFFSREFISDSSAAILNQKAAELLGWDDPIGKKINNWSNNLRGDFNVIGVVEDYHYESLHQDVRPMAIFLSGGYYTNTESAISVRVNTGDLSNTIRFIQASWDNAAPGMPFQYSFLSEEYDNLYNNEQRTSQLYSVFAFLAVFIAALGLFGLSSFVVDQRTKEIGIRKVLGASVPVIVGLLGKSFMRWVILANVIAWPLAWITMNSWLQGFAYPIEQGFSGYLTAGLLALVIAVLAVSYQAISAATKNPVDALQS